jgi:hypothetical protein
MTKNVTDRATGPRLIAGSTNSSKELIMLEPCLVVDSDELSKVSDDLEARFVN